MTLSEFFDSIKSRVAFPAPKEVLVKQFFKKELIVPGSLLHESGKVCRKAIYIEKGALRQYSLTKSGAERTYQIAFEGEWVSDLESFMEEKPSQRNIEALEEGIIWVISHSDYVKASQSLPFVDTFLSRLVRKITFDVQKRNAEILELTLEEQYLKLQEEKPEFFRRVPLQIIASYLGVEKQSLSRLRKRIHDKGK